MALMQEAMSREDFERSEKGLPPLKKKSVPRPEPEKPKVKDQISLKGINFQGLLSVKRDNQRNAEGQIFIGYTVRMEVKDGAGVKTLGGWVPESEWQEFMRYHRGKINMEALQV